VKPLILIAALLTLSACSGSPATPSAPVQEPPPAQRLPTCPYWLLRPKTWQEYQILRGTGTFDEATGMILIDPDKLVAGEVNRNTNLEYMTEKGPAIARVWSPAGVQVDTVPDQLGASLLERFDSTQRYIGEAGSYAGPDCTEPEPMVTVNPVEGEVLRVTSKVRRWDGVEFSFTSEMRTVEATKDAVTTTLVENPEQPLERRTAYVNVFDGELAAQWYGVVKVDGSVDVILARRVAQGVNI
jgi:hypothetical protein